MEVDGPQHYVNGLLRRKDLMKEKLYRSKYPDASFTRLRYDVINRLGSGKVARDVAQYIALTHNSHGVRDKGRERPIRTDYRTTPQAHSFGKIPSIPRIG